MRKAMYCLTSVIIAVVLIGFSISVVQAGPCELPEFDLANFGSPVDNPYLPMSVIGKTYVYEADDEDGLIIDYIQFTTDTKLILGVTCTVVYDVEYLMLEDGTSVKLEETWDWHAWDNDGNFWYFGEDTTEYEYDDEWNLIGSNNDGAWEAGQDVAGVGSIAEPGIILPAEPRRGVCYQQEYYEGEAEDRAKVLKLNTAVSIEFGDYDDCLVTKEWTKLDPGNVEHKYYAPGVGLVYIEELKEKTVNVELVEITF